MLPDSETCANHSPAQTTPETEEDAILDLHVKHCVEKIVQIASKKSSEDSIAELNDKDEIIDIVGEWKEFGWFLRNDHVTENSLDLHHDNKCSPFTEASPKSKDESHHVDSPSKQCEVVQGESSSSECPIVQNTSMNNIQKAPMNSKTSTDPSCASDYDYYKNFLNYNYDENEDYSLRLSDDSEDGSSVIFYEINSSSTEKVQQPEATNHAALDNPADDCLAEKLKVGKAKNVTINNTFSMQPKIVIKRLPIPVSKSKMPIEVKNSKAGFIKMGKYYFANLKRINGSLQCSFNECTFSADNWKVMYNHAKFSHLKKSKSRTNSDLNNRRNKRKDIPTDVDKVDMRVQIILEKLPTKIINLKTPIPITQWLPHSITKTSLSDYQFLHLPTLYKRKVISAATQKYQCAFGKCMFFSNNYRIMHLHVKLCHIPLYRRCNRCLEEVRRYTSRNWYSDI